MKLADIAELEAPQLLDDARPEFDAPLLAFRAHDGDPRLEVGRADVDDEAAGESRDQSLIDVGDLRRRTVARHHDLAAAPLHRVEQTQKLGLGLAAAGEKLHVVDEEHVHPLVALLEALPFTARDRRAELLDEIVQGDILDVEIRSATNCVVADRAHQVCLPKAGTAVNEERVIYCPWRFGDRPRRGDGQPIGRADDEVVEAVARIDLHAWPISPACSIA